MERGEGGKLRDTLLLTVGWHEDDPVLLSGVLVGSPLGDADAGYARFFLLGPCVDSSVSSVSQAWANLKARIDRQPWVVSPDVDQHSCLCAGGASRLLQPVQVQVVVLTCKLTAHGRQERTLKISVFAVAACYCCCHLQPGSSWPRWCSMCPCRSLAATWDMWATFVWQQVRVSALLGRCDLTDGLVGCPAEGFGGSAPASRLGAWQQ